MAKRDRSKSEQGAHCGLSVQIVKQAIVIRLPVDVLAVAVRAFTDLGKWDEEAGRYLEPTVTNPRLFAKDVLRALEDEGEDGSTLVTRMFDAAFTAAVENGAEGIRLPGDDDDDDDFPEAADAAR